MEPYANYFHGFVQAISKSPYLLIIGYGVGDEHINYWLKESSLIHRQEQRVIEITDNNDPSHFVSQKFGAYDLNWHKHDDHFFHSDAGAFYLTYTGGLLDGTALPTEKFLEFLAS